MGEMQEGWRVRKSSSSRVQTKKKFPFLVLGVIQLGLKPNQCSATVLPNIHLNVVSPLQTAVVYFYTFLIKAVSLNIFLFLNPVWWNRIGKLLVTWEEQE